MIYGLFQYYHDELKTWNRVVEFHKIESGELVRQITVVIDQQINSPANEKESSSYIDQFMVQQQEFDHILHQIASQQQRLQRTASFPDKPLDSPLNSQQGSLRSQMQRIERNFIRTKFSCAIFLSSFLNDHMPVPLKLKVRNLA
jgi:hypothetical protein